MKKVNWVTTIGSELKQNGNVIEFRPKPSKPPEMNGLVSTPPTPTGMGQIMSNIYFVEGILSFKIKLHGKLSNCQLLLSKAQNQTYICINEAPYAYSIKSWDPLKQQQAILVAGVGNNDSFQPNDWINIEIEVIGSIIIYRINEVEVIRTALNLYRSQIAFWCVGSDPVDIKEINVEIKKPKVFVVMEFKEEFNEIYTDVIVPVCEDFELEVIRADDIYNNGQILQDIINSIIGSALIIADITPDNPNVYYEVGYSHAAGKNVILLCNSKREKLPFDISGLRTIFYQNSIAGKTKVETQLRKHLENLLPYRTV